MPKSLILPRGGWPAHLAFFALALGILGWVVLDAGWGRLVTYGPGSDVWEHVTAIAAWSRDLLHPAHPHVDGDAPSARFIPLYAPSAMVVALTGLSPLDAFFAGAVVHTIVLLAGLWWFVRAAFESDWAPALAVVVLFCLWGQGWGWSNAYDLRAYLLVDGYPSMGVFALTFCLWAWCLRLLRPSRGSLGAGSAGIAVLTATMVISHPPTAVFALVGAATLTVFDPVAVRGPRMAVGGALIAGAVLALAWPYFPLWDLVTGAETDIVVSPVAYLEQVGVLRPERIVEHPRSHYFYAPGQLIERAGAGLLGLLALIAAGFYRRDRWLAVGGAVMALPYAVNILVPVPLGHRFLFYLLAFGHLALVAVLVRGLTQPVRGAGWRSRAAIGGVRLIVVAGLGYALVTETVFAANAYRVAWEGVRADPDGVSPVVERYRALAAVLPEDAVVLTDRTTAFGLPAFRGTVVYPKRGTHFLADRVERLGAVKAFLAAGTADGVRDAIVARFGVTHVIVADPEAPADLLDYLETVGRPVPVSIEDRIFALRRGKGQSRH